ncbi:MAG: hypothetical protein ACJA0N_002502 [Pseudohongiellaceae bacterium]|jgi:hypothetical protein
MRTFDKDKAINLDLNNLSSRKLWEMLNNESHLSLCEKQHLTITLRTRRHYIKELDGLQSQPALH